MKRINKIDLLRAIGIILMILGHVFYFFGKFDRYIHTFHMPLFFVISGYLYKSRPESGLCNLILKKAKRLLIPYASFAVINYIFWFFLEKDGGSWYEPLIRLMTYNTSGLPICGALWFLTTLFWTEVFYLLFDRWLKNEKVRTAVLLMIAVAASCVQNDTTYRLPLTIDTALVCLGFYEIGRLCKRYGEGVYGKLARLGTIKTIGIGIMLAIVNAALAFVNPYVNIKSGWYGYIPLFWINALLGVSACYMLVMLLDCRLKDTNIVKKYLIFVGKGSIIFFGFNQLAILCAGRLLEAVLPNLNPWITGAVVFFIVMIVLHLLCYMGRKLNNKVLNIMFGL